MDVTPHRGNSISGGGNPPPIGFARNGGRRRASTNSESGVAVGRSESATGLLLGCVWATVVNALVHDLEAILIN